MVRAAALGSRAPNLRRLMRLLEKLTLSQRRKTKSGSKLPFWRSAPACSRAARSFFQIDSLHCRQRAHATETVKYELGAGEIYCRPRGEPLQPDRDNIEGMETQRASMGSKIFSAQYQQNPLPADGNMINSDWLRQYDFVPGERRFGRVVLSCDPAGKAGSTMITPRLQFSGLTISTSTCCMSCAVIGP
jgi:hypothetical protein